MDPIGVIDWCFTIVGKIKDRIELVQTNKDNCKLLVEQVEMIMKPTQRFKRLAKDNPDLIDFAKKMESILTDIDKLMDQMCEKPGVKDKLKKAYKAGDYEEELNRIKERLKAQSQLASYLALCKQYEDDHVKSAKQCASWTLPFQTCGLFCLLTSERHVVIGGYHSKQRNAWEIRAYDQDGEEQWHWELSSELGQPTDIAQVNCTVGGVKQDYYAVALEEANKIVLFDPRTRSVLPEPAYTVPDKKSQRLRKMALMSAQRLVVSLDPTWGADSSLTSKLKVLNCTKSEFTEIRTVDMQCLDIHSLTQMSRGEVAVACGRVDRIVMCDVDNGHHRWELDPKRVNNVEVHAEGVCSVGGDICVYDGSTTRLIAACKGVWGLVLLEQEELGEQVYGMNYDYSSKKLIILHEKEDQLRLTTFDIITGKD